MPFRSYLLLSFPRLPAVYSMSDLQVLLWAPNLDSIKMFTCFLLNILHHFHHRCGTFYPPAPTCSGENVLGQEQRALSMPLGTTLLLCLSGWKLVLLFLCFLSFLRNSKGTPGRERNICCGLQAWWNKVANGKCSVWFWDTVLSLSTCVPWPAGRFSLHGGQSGERP